MEKRANAVHFDVDSDGDFGYELLFTTMVHEDRNRLTHQMIENLRKLNKTFRTSREYVNVINECISRFLKAYDSDKTEYYDNKYEDVWFVRNHDEFVYSFNLYNGNQSINIQEKYIEVKKIEGGYTISQ